MDAPCWAPFQTHAHHLIDNTSCTHAHKLQTVPAAHSLTRPALKAYKTVTQTIFRLISYKLVMTISILPSFNKIVQDNMSTQ